MAQQGSIIYLLELAVNYSSIVLKSTGDWDMIIASDKKEIILSKIQEYNLDSIEMNKEIEPSLKELYPTISIYNTTCWIVKY